jgi:hypothetical protein
VPLCLCVSKKIAPHRTPSKNEKVLLHPRAGGWQAALNKQSSSSQKPPEQIDAAIAMGDDKLKLIAAELITQVKKSVTIDWTLREGARAKIKVMVKRILSRYGYPPDLQDEAVRTVLMQAELLCAEWTQA